MDEGYFQQCNRKKAICGKSEGLHSIRSSIIYLYKTCSPSKGINTPSVKRQASSGSFEVMTLGLTLENGSGTDFGASQCIPMGPCHLTRRLTLGVVMS